MLKFVIEPNKIYPVVDNSGFFFIRVIERWYSDYKVELSRLFGLFVFDYSPEVDEEEEDEEA